MSNPNALVVVVVGVAIGCGILLAQEPICDAPNCDCEVIKAGTKDCTFGLTPCHASSPTYNEETKAYECPDAHYYESGWPTGCKKSSWSTVTVYDANGDEEVRLYDSTTNCNEVNTKCHHPATCKVEVTLQGQVCVPDEETGEWGWAQKFVEVSCGDP